MTRTGNTDRFFASGSFLDTSNNIVDVVVFTGQRPTRPGWSVGHFIIEVFDGETDPVVHEVAFGSNEVRHPSVSAGVREAWSIATREVQVHFGRTWADSVNMCMTSLVIGESVLNPTPDVFDTHRL